MYNPIIFDLDGTLLNSLADLMAAGNYALEQCGFPTHTESEYQYFVGNGIPKLIERICPPDSDEETLKRVHEIFTEYYEQHKSDLTRPYEGMRELLEELRESGIIAVCNTNKVSRFAEELLRQFYGDTITEVVGAGRGFEIKPDPGAALYLAEKYAKQGCKPLYVGDSNVDMQTAINAQMDVCAVLWGFRTREDLEKYDPAHIAENAEQLRDVIFGGRNEN